MSKGAKKPRLADYSRITLTNEQHAELRELLLRLEQPITTAILGAVMTEHELDIHLRQKFKRMDAEAWATMVSDRGPLNTFHSKIIMGHALGLYNEKIRDDLHKIRAIRNAFAHSKKVLTFNDELIIAELTKVYLVPKRFKKYIQRKTRHQDSTKAVYVALCQEVTLKLMNLRVRKFKAITRQKLKSNPFLSLSGKGSLPARFPHRRSDSPSPLTQLGLLYGSLPKDPDPNDKEGK